MEGYRLFQPVLAKDTSIKKSVIPTGDLDRQKTWSPSEIDLIRIRDVEGKMHQSSFAIRN